MSVIILSLLVLNFHTTPSSTFPLNAREVETGPDGLVHGYVDDPRGRGTVGIILSCLVTLALCVWSALHLNVRMKSETRPQRYLRYIKWILLGTFIPELVVLSAWKQWLSAKSMSYEMKKILDEEHAHQKEGGQGVDFSQVRRFCHSIVRRSDNSIRGIPQTRQLQLPQKRHCGLSNTACMQAWAASSLKLIYFRREMRHSSRIGTDSP